MERMRYNAVYCGIGLEFQNFYVLAILHPHFKCWCNANQRWAMLAFQINKSNQRDWEIALGCVSYRADCFPRIALLHVAAAACRPEFLALLLFGSFFLEWVLERFGGDVMWCVMGGDCDVMMCCCHTVGGTMALYEVHVSQVGMWWWHHHVCITWLAHKWPDRRVSRTAGGYNFLSLRKGPRGKQNTPAILGHCTVWGGHRLLCFLSSEVVWETEIFVQIRQPRFLLLRTSALLWILLVFSKFHFCITGSIQV